MVLLLVKVFRSLILGHYCNTKRKNITPKSLEDIADHEEKSKCVHCNINIVIFEILITIQNLTVQNPMKQRINWY